MTKRMEGATEAVRRAVAAACGIAVTAVEPDDDLAQDLRMDEIERESFSLILEEVFGFAPPHELWASPLHRTPAGLAEWIVRRSDQAAWWEASRRRRRA